MIFQHLAAFILSLMLWFWALPAQALDYSPSLSLINSQLRGQDFSGQTLGSAELSHIDLQETNFANASLRGAVFSGSNLSKANFHGADLTNAIADQANFSNADLSDAILSDSILLRSVFNGTNITGADFTNAILNGSQTKELCQRATGVNSQTSVATRDSLGC